MTKWISMGKASYQSPPKRQNYYLYKDTFLSGWGRAPRGSYVITDKKVDRKDFKLLGESSDIKLFHFASGSGRHIELWKGIRDSKVGRPKKTYRLFWVGKNKRLVKRPNRF